VLETEEQLRILSRQALTDTGSSGSKERDSELLPSYVRTENRCCCLAVDDLSEFSTEFCVEAEQMEKSGLFTTLVVSCNCILLSRETKRNLLSLIADLL
jgi:hypothetical protein